MIFDVSAVADTTTRGDIIMQGDWQTKEKTNNIVVVIMIINMKLYLIWYQIIEYGSTLYIL